MAENNLKEYVDTKNLTCLNESGDHPFHAAIITDPSNDKKVESDADEELLVFVPFTQGVRLTHISVRGPSNGPRTVKLFSGQKNFNFDDVAHFKPSQTLKLTQTNIENGDIIPLETFHFAKLDCVTIFFADNQEDDDVTSLSSISLFGAPHGSMNMKELKKVG
eukprot:CAMPEP_0201519082 /NCGR_PEP_ID=MMETSP0161_2-20130828/9729_1 /ASSEMBLY_ACC=CAM_ASM_000251 /TAXON_ID=180227 /ORGANISM="Neoparamoeba aestuarina, Strain SoJaBio B1-5/56/2" /LENGTH=162 /DNA_ID=CAMNT_0047917015 /DNA_START=45 /DNA_END=533 /DNA_ORIENTATION=-